MYDIKFLNQEKIELISDNTFVYINGEERLCSSIITNKRYLILDYPSGIYNSAEDLRIAGRGDYIRKKEVIFSINISDIREIVNDNKFDKVIFKNDEYVLINDSEIVLSLKSRL